MRSIRKYLVFSLMSVVLFGTVANAAQTVEYLFDETSGLTAADTSGNGYDGTLDYYAGDDSQWVSGLVDGALNFPGGARVLAGASSTAGQIFTISFFMKADLAANIAIENRIYKETNWEGGAGTGSGFGIRGNSSGGLDVYGGFDGWVGAYSFSSTGAAILDGTWKHIAVTNDYGDVKLYIDGVLNNSTTYNAGAGGYTTPDTPACGFSHYLTDYDYIGLLDEFETYDTALSAPEIADLADAGLNPPVNVARNPGPDDGDEAPNDTVLNWTAGDNANSHDVYFGSDFAEVNDAGRQAGDIDGDSQVDLNDLLVIVDWWLSNAEGSEPYANPSEEGIVNLIDFAIVANDWMQPGDATFKGNQAGTTYDPGTLAIGQSYYWRIDEVNGPDVWRGNVWDFTVSEFPVLSFDVGQKTGRTFDGFGAMVWSGMAPATVFEELNVKYIRMDMANAAGAFSKAVATCAVTDPLGIKPVYVVMNSSIPSAWCSTDSGHPYLLPEYFDEFADMWVDIATGLDAAGIRPPYIELINECDVWHNRGYLSPANYNILVKMVRAELDSQGFSDVDIVGPGVAHIDHVSPWDESDLRIDNLDSTGVAAHAAWSTHAWLWSFNSINAEGGQQYLRDSWPNFGDSVDAKDPAGEKPIFITEYATFATTFHGVSYPDPGGTNGYSASSTVPYAVRCFENTLSLINYGANVPFFWEAQDASWSGAGYGLVNKTGVPRPTFHALKTLCSKVPVGAEVLIPPISPDSPNDIYAAGFVKDGQLVVALVNGTALGLSKRIEIAGIVGDMEIISAVAFRQVDPANVDECETVDKNLALNFNESSGKYDFCVWLPSDSTLTVVCDFGMLP